VERTGFPMTDPNPNGAAAPVAPASLAAAPAASRRGRGLLLGLLLPLLLLALGYVGWQQLRLQRFQDAQAQQLRRLGQQLDAVQDLSASLDTRQSDLASVAQRNSAELADFGRRIEEHDQIVGRLNEQMAGGHDRLQLAAVENLLLLANDRLQLARDLKAALLALDEADRRLGELRDPRLFNVRQAIAEERSALQAVPQPDYAGVALRLSSLAARAERLPLRARAPDQFQADAAASAPAADAGSAWAQLRASVGAALRSMFTLRRRQGPAATLLAPQEEALVHRILMLRLESARVALLRGDTVNFRDSCSAAARWLTDYFRSDDVAVQTALAELERLQTLDLAPPLPDLARSLSLLRSHLEAAAR